VALAEIVLDYMGRGGKLVLVGATNVRIHYVCITQNFCGAVTPTSFTTYKQYYLGSQISLLK